MAGKAAIVTAPERQNDGDITDHAVAKAGDLMTVTGGSLEAGVGAETAIVVSTIVRMVTIEEDTPSEVVVREDLEADRPGTGAVETTVKDKETGVTLERVEIFSH